MYFQFFLDEFAIEQPEGFADIVLSLVRDDNWHGIFFEASISSLGFYGGAATYLQEKRRTEGMKANISFRAMEACGVYEEAEELLEGRLDFAQYSETCGSDCFVSYPVEQTGCVMTLRNRYDQQVDMDAQVSFDKLTAVAKYAKMGAELSLPARDLEVMVKGNVVDAGDSTTFSAALQNGDTVLTFRPTYAVEIKNSIATGELIPSGPEGWFYWGPNPSATYIDISPQLLFDDISECYKSPLSYSFLLKGSFSVQGHDSALLYSKLKVVTWDGRGNIFENSTVLQSFSITTGVLIIETTQTRSFNRLLSGNIKLPNGTGLYAFLELVVNAGFTQTITANITFDKESAVDIISTKSCPPTTSKTYPVNESLSHIVEVITDGCMKVKSDYYGRYDSQPYTSEADGCGSLRVLAGGLNLRKAQPQNLFMSFKDAFEGLAPIDNIGIGVEKNTFLPGSNWLRVEPVEYFYQDKEVMVMRAVPKIEFRAESGYYSLVQVGYKKWEATQVNSLDEFNSTKDFRTSLSSVNKTLQILSSFIAGSYPIEVTRQQSFAATGGADTKYDNDIFIICVDRDGYGLFKVERGNILSPANIFSPQTAYNWRIRPYSNLQRWFKSIANSYPNISDVTNRLYFVSGTGNYLAAGELANTVYIASGCKLENGVKAENREMAASDFADAVKATPLFKPETASFQYILSIKEYQQLKANPYGFISFQCGNGLFRKGFIKRIDFRPAGDKQGEANVTLRLKWE